MLKVTTVNSITSVLNAIATTAQVVETTSNAVNNIAKLGEQRTSFMLKEQEKLLQRELDALDQKVEKTFESKAQSWQSAKPM